MITIDNIKEQYIEPALNKLPYHFHVFTDEGAYKKAVRNKNVRKSIINAIMTVTESDIALLGGGLKASAMNISIRFLIPVPDECFDEDGNYVAEYSYVDTFRDRLSSVISTSAKIELADDDGTTYIGAAACGFPLSGELAQRQGIGYSFEYTCYLEVAYIKNAVNSSDVVFYLDNTSEVIPCSGFAIGRNSTLSANLMSDSQNGQSGVYSENSVFTIDLTMPATLPTDSDYSMAMFEYLMGSSNMNEEHTLRIVYNGTPTNISVIIAKVVDSGEGAANVSRQVSFVPLLEAEDDNDETGDAIPDEV